MLTTMNELIESLRATLAGTAGLAGVQLADSPDAPDAAQLPAATFVPAGLDGRAGDPVDDLMRARFELTLWRRDASRSANAVALMALASAAIEALLADPTQGGLAVIGPNGLASELLEVRPARATPPLGGLTVRFACWQIPPQGLAALPADQRVLIGGADLLGSGPHALTVGDWARRRLDRRFAGLDGLLSIDLGAGGRPMTIRGRLVADSAASLMMRVAAIEALAEPGALHTVAAPDGRSFANVRMEDIRAGRVLSAAGKSAVGYELSLLQLAGDA